MDNAIATPIATPLVPASPPFGERLAALPARAKAMAVIGIAALFVVLALLATSSRQGDYKLLFASLSERDGGAIVEKLAQMNVPYRFADGGDRKSVV